MREIFERYAKGDTKAEIVRDLQRRKVKTSFGNDFTYNSLSRLLTNKRYIGIYLYKGVETPGGMPRILDDDLFYRVQDLMNKNKSAPARTRGENEYLLTTKLFCGHCKEMMVGYGGTGKAGKQYHYYMCKKARKKKCNKKICLSEAQVMAFLDYICEMPLDDFKKRRVIVNIFVHSVYLYDDHFTLIINASMRPLSIENIPLNDIETAFEGEKSDIGRCSAMLTPAPPWQNRSERCF